jgi:hypothetical protein
MLDGIEVTSEELAQFSQPNLAVGEPSENTGCNFLALLLYKLFYPTPPDSSKPSGTPPETPKGEEVD